jgi:nickel transport system permease protein
MGMTNVVICNCAYSLGLVCANCRSIVLNLRHRDYIWQQERGGVVRSNIPSAYNPPVLAQLMILATLDLGHMMLHVSGLSFLDWEYSLRARNGVA